MKSTKGECSPPSFPAQLKSHYSGLGDAIELRTYPPKFGERLAALHPRFCRNRTTWFGTHLDLDDQSMGTHLFSSMPWEDMDWRDDAQMKSVFEYLRGAKGLWLGEMRPFFPSEIPI